MTEQTPGPAPPPARPNQNWWPLGMLIFGIFLLFPMMGIFGMVFSGPRSNVVSSAFVFFFFVLLVGVGLMMSRTMGWTPAPRVASRPGFPAPFGAPLYGVPKNQGSASLRDRLRLVPEHLRLIHVKIVWSLAGLVGLAGIFVLAGILFGPNGTAAAVAGLILLVGWGMTVAAYFVAGYRALLPAAMGLFLFGVFLHVDAVADAWGWGKSWDSSYLMLFALFAMAQAFGAEASFRQSPRRFWAAWTILGTCAAAAMPIWEFFGGSSTYGNATDYPGQIAAGLSLASLPWGIAAVFAYGTFPNAIRWTGIGVFAFWSASIVAATGWETDFAQRLQAASFVAAAIVSAVAVTAYFVMRPRGAQAAA